MKNILLSIFALGLCLAATPKNSTINIGNEMSLTLKNSSNLSEGYQISNLDKNSIYSQIGFKQGDVIKSIDGKKVDSPSDLVSLLEKKALDWEAKAFDDSFIDKELEKEALEFGNIEKDFL